MKADPVVARELKWLRWLILLILGVLLLLLSYQDPRISGSALGQVVSLAALYAGLSILVAAALVLLWSLARVIFGTAKSEVLPADDAAEKAE